MRIKERSLLLLLLLKSDKIFPTDFFTGGNKGSVEMCPALMSHKGPSQ